MVESASSPIENQTDAWLRAQHKWSDQRCDERVSRWTNLLGHRERLRHLAPHIRRKERRVRLLQIRGEMRGQNGYLHHPAQVERLERLEA